MFSCRLEEKGDILVGMPLVAMWGSLFSGNDLKTNWGLGLHCLSCQPCLVLLLLLKSLLLKLADTWRFTTTDFGTNISS